MSSISLQEIQQLQFTDKSAAEALLTEFIRDVFPNLYVESVELRPLAISLNSFNGFLSLLDGQRLFFKTHTESDNVIGEYYRSAILADAGYPVIQPKYSSTEAGKHLLIYDVIDDPAVFDVAWQIENGNSQNLDLLRDAQHKADDELLEYYQATLTYQTAEQAAQAPIHQLFYHRLKHGRLHRFYGDDSSDRVVMLPHGKQDMNDVRRVHWTINGQHYDDTLEDVIQRAIYLLQPEQAGSAIIGHGDAHNGNVFLQRDEAPPRLLYFDPAFAGSHHPLLDLAKPLFHNVFAMWMYFPQEKQEQTNIRLSVDHDNNRWIVEHDYHLPEVRTMFLDSKTQRVLIPILKELKQRDALKVDWRAYLKAALFCCPFLTMNLTDAERFPPEISLLGLSMSIEMGAESSDKKSVIDQLLDDISGQIE